MSLKSIKLTTFAVVIASIVIFFPMLYFAPRQELFEMVDAVIVSACVGLCITSWSSTRIIMTKNWMKLTAAEFLILGLFIISTALGIVFSGQFVWRVLDKPDWIIDSGFLAFSRWVLAGGLLVVMAIANEVIGPRAYVKIASGVGFFLLLTLMYVAGNLT